MPDYSMRRPVKPISKLLLSLSACALLAACQTSQATKQGINTGDDMDAAIARAQNNAAERSGTTGSIGYLEKVYKRDSTDPISATDYAHALREGDYLSRAEMVLAPFANDPASPAMTKTEYAAIQLAQGNYKSAENYAQKAVLQDDQDYKAYHYLGIALDAQGMHPEGERAFRKALDHWQGDPTTVMNNLALNLAAQEYLQEALEILEKAKAVSPNRIEVERNLRIVTALMQSTGYKAPKPKAKPHAPKDAYKASAQAETSDNTEGSYNVPVNN